MFFLGKIISVGISGRDNDGEKSIEILFKSIKKITEKYSNKIITLKPNSIEKKPMKKQIKYLE